MIQIPTSMIIILLALGIGYIALYFASKSEGLLKSLGKVIAILIICLSAFALIMDILIGIIILTRARSMSRSQAAQQQAPAQRTR